MKMVKIIASFLAVTMLFSSVSVFAENSQQEESDTTEAVIENSELISESSNSTFVVDLKSEQGVEVGLDDSSVAVAEPSQDQLSQANLTNVASGQNFNKNKNRANGQQLYHFTGAISEEGGMFPITFIPLQPNEILHSQLFMPNNPSLDYDLYLYEMDADGYLIGNPLDVSTYSGSTLNETVATVNKSASQKMYCVLAFASVGFSATDEFDLFLSIGTTFDSYENNDNAFTSSDFGSWGINDLEKVNATLNSPLDNDWYSFHLDNTKLDAIEVKLNSLQSSNIVMDLYYASSGTSLSKVTRVNMKNATKWNINAGTIYYLRVSYNINNDYVPVEYNIECEPLAKPDFAEFEVTVGGEPIKTSSRWADGKPRYVILNYDEMKFKVTYKTSEGNIAKSVNDTAYLAVTNSMWNIGTANYRKSNTSPVVDGIAEARVTLGSLYTTYGIYEPVQVEMRTSLLGSYYDGQMMLVKRYEL